MLRLVSLLSPPIMMLASCASRPAPEPESKTPDRPPVAEADRAAANLAGETVRPASGEAEAIVVEDGEKVGVIKDGGPERTRELGAEDE